MGKCLQAVCAALVSGLQAGASLGCRTFHSILGGWASSGLPPEGVLPPDPVS